MTDGRQSAVSYGNYRDHQGSGNRTSFGDLVRHLLETPRKTWRVLPYRGLEVFILKVGTRIGVVIWINHLYCDSIFINDVKMLQNRPRVEGGE